MPDVFSTDFLMKAVREFPRPSSFLLNTYFRYIQQSDAEEIHFDVVTSNRGLAPFVSSYVAGGIVAEKGVTTKSFKPAYVKIRTPLAPKGSLKRIAGEKIGGDYTPQERTLGRIRKTIDDQIMMIMRRKEVMAAEVLRTGASVIEGEDYPTQIIDYGRDPELTRTLVSAARWGEAGVNPLYDLQDWALLVLKKSGFNPNIITMDVDAWRLFVASPDVKNQLDTRNITGNTIENKAQASAGGVYQGRIGGFEFYTYADFYLDANGVLQSVLPSYTVLMGGDGIEGTQVHGAIIDDEAGMQALEFFTKSWLEPDPSLRQVMTQSAPLIVPCNPNACLSATVR